MPNVRSKLKNFILRARPETIIALYTVPYATLAIAYVAKTALGLEEGFEHYPLWVGVAEGAAHFALLMGPYTVAVSLAEMSGMSRAKRRILYVSYPGIFVVSLIAFLVHGRQLENSFLVLLVFIGTILAGASALIKISNKPDGTLLERFAWFMAFLGYYPIGAIFIHKQLSSIFREE